MNTTPDNSKKASSKQPSSRTNERGAALATAILMLGLLSAITMTVLAVVSTETRVAGGDLQRTQAFYAAAAGIEKMSSDFNALFARTSRPAQTSLNNIAAAPPNLTGEGFSFSQSIQKDEATLATMRATQNITTTGNPPVGANPNVTVPNGPLIGLTASVVPYILTTTANSATAQVSLERRMNNYLVPIFQFGMFSDDDMEIHPGPAFTFNGRVHANGNLYLNGNVTFLDKVTTASEVVRDVLRNGATHTGTVQFNSGTLNVGSASVVLGPNVSGNYPTSPNGTTNLSWKTNSVATYAGQLLTSSTGVAPLKLPLQLDGNPTREIIHRRVQNDDPTLSDSRYHSKAEIRILIDDETAVDASGATATPLNGDGTTNAGLLLSTFDPIPLPNTATNASITANGGGRALWRITDSNTTFSNSYTNETTTSYVTQQQNGTARQADTVRGIRIPATKPITNATKTNAGLITIVCTGHGFSTGDTVVISGVVNTTGPTANSEWAITVVNANNFTLNLSTSGGTGTYTANTGTVYKLPTTAANGTIIPSGSGIKGRILIQIVDANGVARDVTQQILSMGVTVGEPNAIVMLQRPLWAAFTQGSRDGSATSPVPNPALNGDPAYTNCLTDILNKTHIGADGEIKTTAPNPLWDSVNGYLTQIVDDTASGVNPIRSDIVPVLNGPGDWGALITPSATWIANREWNSVVPINVYNVREGRISTTSTSPSTNANDVYERGVMSVVEVNMRNLARWVDGVYDQNLLAGTSAVSTNIAAPDGYIVYVSDRRGDKVRATVDATGLTMNSSNGMVDNLDIYGPDGTMDGGEDVQNTGLAVGSSLGSSLTAPFLKDISELPDPASLNITSLNANTPALRMQRALAVAGWLNPGNYFRRSVRLFNGQALQISGRATLSTTKGITVASENMVYIWGDYNTDGINVAPASGISSLNDSTVASHYMPTATDTQVPASVVCDAYFQLSKTWFDSVSAIYPDDQTKRPADNNLPGVTDETSVRTGIIAGNNLSSLSVTTGVDAGNYSSTSDNNESRLNGGMHNFPRFLENWGVRFNFVGSLIPLYHSTQALGQYNANSTIYGAPSRNWAFDVTFRQSDRLPPGTPQFQYIEPTAFRQILY